MMVNCAVDGKPARLMKVLRRRTEPQVDDEMSIREIGDKNSTAFRVKVKAISTVRYNGTYQVERVERPEK